MASYQCLRIIAPSGELDTLRELLSTMNSLGFEERLPGGVTPPVLQPWDEGPPPPPAPILEILAWFELDGQEPERLAQVRQALGSAAGVEIFDDRLSDGDWVERWRTEFRPFEVGPGAVIAPPWDVPPGALIIEPGVAFGTGDHPTTRACLDAIYRLGKPGMSLLDVGCGSGILALFAASRGLLAQGVDIDPIAVRSAHENAALNHMELRFDTRPASAIPGSFDLVVANLFAEEIARIGPELIRLTRGVLVIAGVLLERESRAIDALSPGLDLRQRKVEGEWVSMEWSAR